MPTVQPDDRSDERRRLDDAIAAEGSLPPPMLPGGVVPRPIESFESQTRSPRAIAGIVDHGVVKPLDSSIKLPDRSRVIIIAASEAAE